MTIIKQASDDKYNIDSTKTEMLRILEAQQSQVNDTINTQDRYNSTEQDLDATRLQDRVRMENGQGPGVPRQQPLPVREVGADVPETVAPGLGVKDRQTSTDVNLPEASPLNEIVQDTFPSDGSATTEGQLEKPETDQRSGNPNSGLNKLVYDGKPMTGPMNENVIDFGNGSQMSKYRTVTRDQSKKPPEEPAPSTIRVQRGGGKPGKR